jgi:hypothetical protein
MVLFLEVGVRMVILRMKRERAGLEGGLGDGEGR